MSVDSDIVSLMHSTALEGAKKGEWSNVTTPKQLGWTVGTINSKTELPDITPLMDRLKLVEYYGKFYAVNNDHLNVPLNQLHKVSIVYEAPTTHVPISVGFPPSFDRYIRSAMKDAGLSNSGLPLVDRTRNLISAIIRGGVSQEEMRIFRNSIAAGLIEINTTGDVRNVFGRFITDEEEEEVNELFAPRRDMVINTKFPSYDLIGSVVFQKLEMTLSDLVQCGRVCACILSFFNQTEAREKLEALFNDIRDFMVAWTKLDLERWTLVTDRQIDPEKISSGDDVTSARQLSVDLADSLLMEEFSYRSLDVVLEKAITHIQSTFSYFPNPIVFGQAALIGISNAVADNWVVALRGVAKDEPAPRVKKKTA